MFVPFQRLGDTDNTTGVGLGLALSRGPHRGDGRHPRAAEDTPGGGLTMTLSLPARPPAQARHRTARPAGRGRRPGPPMPARPARRPCLAAGRVRRQAGP